MMMQALDRETRTLRPVRGPLEQVELRSEWSYESSEVTKRVQLLHEWGSKASGARHRVKLDS